MGGWTCRDLFDASQLVDTSLANLQIQAPFRVYDFCKSFVKLMTLTTLLLRTSPRVHCRAACVMSWTSQRHHEKAMQISRPSVAFLQSWDRWQPRLILKSCNAGARWREALQPAPLPITVISCHAVSPLNALETAASVLEGKTFKSEHFPGLVSRVPFVAAPCNLLHMFCIFGTWQLQLAFGIRITPWATWTGMCIL